MTLLLPEGPINAELAEPYFKFLRFTKDFDAVAFLKTLALRAPKAKRNEDCGFWLALKKDPDKF